MEVLKLNNIKKDIVERELFDIKELHMNVGDIIGLVGKNGVGKSTLLRMITGEDTDYKGRIQVYGKVGYVPQLKETSQESGGEQVKRYLTEVFKINPDLLVLDEPTANLDQENIQWVINKLQSFSKTILIVSHDRYVLNQLVNKIWLVANKTVSEYVGTYDEMQTVRDKEKERQQREYQQYQTTVNRLEQEAVQRYDRANKLTKRKKGVSGSEWKARSLAGSYDGQAKSLAKRAKSLEKRIEKLDKVEAPTKEAAFKIKDVGHLNVGARTLINLEAGAVRQGGEKLFSYQPFKVTFGDKIAVQGPNQAGKTSFVRQILEQKLPGNYSEVLRIGYFAQNFTQLNGNNTILENVNETSQQDKFTIRNVLAALGFQDQTVYKKVDVLSGGERVRVALAKVLLSDNNLLILDEPTNYLDISTLEALEDFLNEYQGTIILISHDHEFVHRVSDTKLIIEKGELKTPEHQTNYSSNREQEVQLLKLKRDRMMADPDVPLEELKDIVKQINELEG